MKKVIIFLLKLTYFLSFYAIVIAIIVGIIIDYNTFPLCTDLFLVMISAIIIEYFINDNKTYFDPF
jgi:hypothetical protein